jgi:hypothetical protein
MIPKQRYPLLAIHNMAARKTSFEMRTQRASKLPNIIAEYGVNFVTLGCC